MTERNGQPQPARPTRPFKRVTGGVLIALLSAFVLAGPLYVLLSQGRSHQGADRARSGPEIPAMASFGGTPVDIATLDAELAAMYRGAKAHAGHFKDVPCFCGCDRTRLEHRHLLDCFVLKDGGGWESHATGCAVCQGEARLALELYEQGVDPDEVRDLVVAEFGMSEAMREMLDEEMK